MDFTSNITKDTIIGKDETYLNYYKKDKKTRAYMTKYEKAKLFGIRMQQISTGAQPLVTITGKVSLKEIVKEEFLQNKLPLMIRRYLPDGTIEDWRISDLHYNLE